MPTADLPSATESSAAEESASDVSYSADEMPEERFAPAQQPRSSLPSSKACKACTCCKGKMVVPRIQLVMQMRSAATDKPKRIKANTLADSMSLKIGTSQINFRMLDLATSYTSHQCCQEVAELQNEAAGSFD